MNATNEIQASIAAEEFRVVLGSKEKESHKGMDCCKGKSDQPAEFDENQALGVISRIDFERVPNQGRHSDEENGGQ